MKKIKINEVIAVHTQHDITKMHERVGYYLGLGKKVDVKIKHGYIHITEKKVKKRVKNS